MKGENKPKLLRRKRLFFFFSRWQKKVLILFCFFPILSLEKRVGQLVVVGQQQQQWLEERICEMELRWVAAVACNSSRNRSCSLYLSPRSSAALWRRVFTTKVQQQSSFFSFFYYTTLWGVYYLTCICPHPAQSFCQDFLAWLRSEIFEILPLREKLAGSFCGLFWLCWLNLLGYSVMGKAKATFVISSL